MLAYEKKGWVPAVWKMTLFMIYKRWERLFFFFFMAITITPQRLKTRFCSLSW